MDNVSDEIFCPACGKKMTKVKMPANGIYLDVCLDGCGGIYFDNREFYKFDEKHEDISALEKAYEGKTFISVDDNGTRICPVCGWTMVKNYASSKREVQIDDCYGCGGKFLDYSELSKIRLQYENEEERVNAVLNDLYMQIGDEIKAQDEKYEKNVKNTNIFSLINKIKKQREKENRKFNKKELEILYKLNKQMDSQ